MLHYINLKTVFLTSDNGCVLTNLPSSSAKGLGTYVSDIPTVRYVNFHLHIIGKIRKYLWVPHYCPYFLLLRFRKLIAKEPMQQGYSLQLVPNTLARIPTFTRHVKHVTSILFIHCRIDLQGIYRSIYGNDPAYLKKLLLRAPKGHVIHSREASVKLLVPKNVFSNMGSSSFPITVHYSTNAVE